MNTFSFELVCDYTGWWRYNVYASIICYNTNNEIIDYCNTADAPYDIASHTATRMAPPSVSSDRIISLSGTACDHAMLNLYVIANTFPESKLIKNSPAFTITVRFFCNGKLAAEKTYPIDQLGGLTVTAEKFPTEGGTEKN